MQFLCYIQMQFLDGNFGKELNLDFKRQNKFIMILYEWNGLPFNSNRRNFKWNTIVNCLTNSNNYVIETRNLKLVHEKWNEIIFDMLIRSRWQYWHFHNSQAITHLISKTNSNNRNKTLINRQLTFIFYPFRNKFNQYFASSTEKSRCFVDLKFWFFPVVGTPHIDCFRGQL